MKNVSPLFHKRFSDLNDLFHKIFFFGEHGGWNWWISDVLLSEFTHVVLFEFMVKFQWLEVNASDSCRSEVMVKILPTRRTIWWDQGDGTTGGSISFLYKPSVCFSWPGDRRLTFGRWIPSVRRRGSHVSTGGSCMKCIIHHTLIHCWVSAEKSAYTVSDFFANTDIRYMSGCC